MNLADKQRILIAVIGLPVAFVTAYLGGWWFLSFICLISSFSVYELLKMIHFPPRVLMVIALIATPVSIISLYYAKFEFFFLIVLMVAIFTNISMLFYKQAEYLKMSFVGIGSILYPGISLGILVLFRNMYLINSSDTLLGRRLVFAILFSVFTTDIFAFYLGRLFGKHKLFPSVSPKKTIEGAIGGFLGCCVTVTLLNYFDFIPFFNYIDYLALAIAAGVFGQIGDLVESKIKRDIGVKDSSKILLEHGGFLDRFDSLATAAPIFWVYMNFKYGML